MPKYSSGVLKRHLLHARMELIKALGRVRCQAFVFFERFGLHVFSVI
jgi:hypothetical protein